ncbi:3,4-dihydroxy-2-butanone-4-phosphate synthase [Alphaproteobacteria bacterium]|nr:3,4-dihydroxy-2-butanone-4-phosphate synthase [Alphaproteobacteria bacterium]
MEVSNIEDIIKEASQGKIFILIDDENRENEGDLCVLGDFVNPNVINFMATHGRGLICLAITKQQSDKLGLSLMERRNESRYDTAFTQSIEAKYGVTTGISASDRSITIKTAINEQNDETHINTPGHVFPIIARSGGTLIRAGHTEAIVDIAKICGLNPSGVICEIMKDNGEMARLPDLKKFAKKHDIKIGTIADLISYRRKTENLLVRTYERLFNSFTTGSWRIIVYKSLIDEVEHLALIKGVITSKDKIMVRVHSFNPVVDILDDLNANGQNNLVFKAMKKIHINKSGIVIIINDSYKDFISKKLKQYEEVDTKDKINLRQYGVGAQILSDLGVKKMILLSNSKKKAIGLKGFELTIVDWKSLD